MTQRHKLALFLVIFGLNQMAMADTTTNSVLVPARQPISPVSNAGYRLGLLAEIYKLSVRPRKLRNPIPGLPASVIKIVSKPVIRSAADLEGISGSVQADFKGEIRFPVTGDYTFSASADDAMDLQIDGKSVLANAWINGSNAPSVVTAKFTEGWHPIHVRFYQGDGGFNLNLQWQTPQATSITEIPDEQFRVSNELLATAQTEKTLNEQKEIVDPAFAHRTVFRNTGFLELPEADGDLLIDLLEGPTLYSESARKDFTQLLKSSNFESLPYWHQVMVLSGFLRGWHTEQTSRGTVDTRAHYVLSEPQATEYDGWRGAKRQGFQHTLTIGDQKFTIYTPTADSPERENVAQAIAGLPSTLRSMLKQVRVEPYGTANEFNGGGDEIWVRRGEPTPLSMLDNTLSHEIGHLLMNRTDCYQIWQEAIAQETLSVSHYGRLNPSEDFAEFVRIYISTKGDAAKIASLQQLFPKRLSVLNTALKQINFEW